MVGVAGEHEGDVAPARAAQRLDRQVEARQAAVHLERGAGRLGGGEDRVEIEIDRRPAADHARREVADHAHRRILHRGDDAPGLRRAVELEVVVHRGEAPVERAGGTRGRSRARPSGRC